VPSGGRQCLFAVHAEYNGGGRGEPAQGKFGYELKFGTMEHFEQGLEKLIGAPRVYIYMTRKGCKGCKRCKPRASPSVHDKASYICIHIFMCVPLHAGPCVCT